MAGPEYTEQDIIRAFGQPDTVMFDEFGYTYTYFFESDISSVQYGNAAEITLYSKPKGPIMTAYVFDGKYIVNGFIRVGDHISKVYEMDGDFSNTQYHKTALEPYSGDLQEQDGKMWSFSIARNSPMTKTGS